jgi:Glyoxalase-like domain
MHGTRARSGIGGERLLGWIVVNHDPDEFEIRPAADRPPGLLFVAVSEQKTMKNRLHLDFRPDDRDAEVERLLRLGCHASGRRARQAVVDCSR